MQTVENPKHLFRAVDASGIGGESYTFNVAKEDTDTLNRDSMAVTQRTVELNDLSDPADDFHAALHALEAAATEVESESEIPDSADSDFVTREDGRQVRYIANTDRMGYEVVKQEEPRIAGYAVIFPDELYNLTE